MVPTSEWRAAAVGSCAPGDLCLGIRNSRIFATMSLAGLNTVEGVPEQGWHRDPFGAHDDRWFSAGRPTPLIRDNGVVSREDLPPDQQSGRRDPAWLSVRRQFPAEAYYWPYWKVVVPSLVAFAAAGLIVAWSLVSQPVNGFDLAGPLSPASGSAGPVRLSRAWPRPPC